jgi:hypothetical protein
VGGACSAHEVDEKCVKMLLESLKKRDARKT